jgi:hypothetical protein
VHKHTNLEKVVQTKLKSHESEAYQPNFDEGFAGVLDQKIGEKMKTNKQGRTTLQSLPRS